MKIETTIQQHFHELNENEKIIAQALIQQQTHIPQLNLKNLAQLLNTSTAAILRLLKKLDISGYSELKFILKNQQQAPRWDANFLLELRNQMLQQIDHFYWMDLTPICEAIDQAENIFVYGTGTVQKNAANELCKAFLYGGRMLHTLDGANETELSLQTALLGENDLLLIFCMSQDSENLKYLRSYTQERKIAIVIISHRETTFLNPNEQNIFFDFKEFSTGIRDNDYGYTAPFFLLVDFLFAKYLVYKNQTP